MAKWVKLTKEELAFGLESGEKYRCEDAPFNYRNELVFKKYALSGPYIEMWWLTRSGNTVGPLRLNEDLTGNRLVWFKKA
jgi:hypothetical protein